ncbi:3-hydroxyacyl-CoA dehydrogenase [Leadbetterella sp. DM7]|uniref:3-hydroxyacyl-CoA dehydrogenase n=1 Tax=Leadbetterella sp. DM7 TaxID=3235085 RepID=UPI00349E634E
MQIKNNTFFVSGGASGLGEATVRMIVENGGNAVIADLNADSGKALPDTLGIAALFVKADITNEEEVIAALNHGTARFGAIHGLINCAGLGPARRVLGKNGVHDLAFFQRIIAVNLTGSFNTLRLAADKMQHNTPNEEGERGVIINTASVAAFEGQIGQAAYSASKGGIVAMTLPIARELARTGIRVMAVAPGIFETPLLAAYTQEVRDSLGAQVPFPSRLGKPEEYARLVKHIIENPMLNGEVIRLDGAIRMAAK